MEIPICNWVGIFLDMSNIDEYINDLINLEITLEAEVHKIILDNSGIILSWIKQRLWNFGIDAAGKSIFPEYTPLSLKLKKEAGKRSSHVTLRDEGGFYDGMFIDIVNNDIVISSTDVKTSLLITKYGTNILGMTLDEQERLINIIIEPKIQLLIDNKTGDIIEI